MRRPLLNVAVAFTAGILVGDYVHVPLLWLLIGSGILGVTALILKNARPVVVVALLFLVGWANMIWRTAVTSPTDLRALLTDKPEIVTVRGTLDASPAEHIFERRGDEMMRTVAYVDVSAIQRGTNTQAATGKIIVMTPGVASEDFFTGQHVIINGVILPPSGPFAEGLFDSKSFLRRKNVYYQLRVASTNDWQVDGNAAVRPLSDRFFRYAKRTLALGLPEGDLPQRLIWTLVLDWKAPMTPSVEEPFVRAGTFHIFAVDGLRIAMITGMVMTLLYVLQVPRSIAGMITIPVIWFYAGLTGFPPSAIRSAIMATIIIAGWALKRPADAINSLFAAAFFILAWEPQQLFQAGFQLSFVVVLCIILILPLIQEWIAKPFEPDPFLPRQIAVAQNFYHSVFATNVRLFITGTFAISLAAWLGSIPLAAYYFHVFNIVSTPANWIVVPLTALALISSLGSLLTGWCLPGTAELFNHATWVLMKWIIAISQSAVHWRPAAINVTAPTLLTTFWYYAVLLALLTGWIFRTKFKRTAIIALSCLTFLCFVQWLSPSPIKLHVLPLNGGQCVLVDSGRVKTDLLIDCGDAVQAEHVTKPFLQAHGVNWLNNCCLSVAHIDAMGGFEFVQTNFSIDRVVTSPTRNRSVAYKRVVAKLDESQSRTIVKAGDHLAGWTVLHPEADDRFSRGDDNAVVLHRKFGDTSVLLLSTLGRDGQVALAERQPDLHADIVIAGLPSNEEPLCAPLLEVLKPKSIVIVDSEFPATRRASEKLRVRLANARVIYCRETGSVTLVFEPHMVKILNATGAKLFESSQ